MARVKGSTTTTTGTNALRTTAPRKRKAPSDTTTTTSVNPPATTSEGGCLILKDLFNTYPGTKEFFALETYDQKENPLWHNARFGRVTASTAYPVEQAYNEYEKRKARYGPEAADAYLKGRLAKIAHKMCNPEGSHTTEAGNPIRSVEAIAYGIKHEDTARKEYAQIMKKVYKDSYVVQTGLNLDKEIVGLGASPDGILKSSECEPIVLEIKCPDSRRGEADLFADVMKKKIIPVRQSYLKSIVGEVVKDPKFCNKIVGHLRKKGTALKEEKLTVSKYYVTPTNKSIGGIPLCNINLNHRQGKQYYSQMQYEMMVTGCKMAHLFVWKEGQCGLVQVPWDPEWGGEKRDRIKHFWEKFLFPHVINGDRNKFLAFEGDKMPNDVPTKENGGWKCIHCDEEAKKLGSLELYAPSPKKMVYAADCPDSDQSGSSGEEDNEEEEEDEGEDVHS